MSNPIALGSRLFGVALFSVVAMVAFAQSPPMEQGSGGQIVLPVVDNWGLSLEYIPPLALPDGKFLVTVVDTIYMMDGEKILWKSVQSPLIAQPVYRADLNEIAFIGIDLTFGILDARTGKLLWHADTQGRAFFKELAPYENGFLVVVGMGNYATSDDEVIPDKLEYFPADEKKENRWIVEIPSGSKLFVQGRKIFAVTQDKKNITLKEIIQPPKDAEN